MGSFVGLTVGILLGFAAVSKQKNSQIKSAPVFLNKCFSILENDQIVLDNREKARSNQTVIVNKFSGQIKETLKK